jgi:hypothetical protein
MTDLLVTIREADHELDFRNILGDTHIPVRFVTRRYAGVACAVDERQAPGEDAQLPTNTAFDDSIARLRPAWGEMIEALTLALSPAAPPKVRS